MAIDMFDTRTMLTVLETAKPAQTFLRDRFFSNVRTFDTKKLISILSMANGKWHRLYIRKLAVKPLSVTVTPPTATSRLKYHRI